jgi:beta-glucosidase-like glycosyl hydrolase
MKRCDNILLALPLSILIAASASCHGGKRHDIGQESDSDSITYIADFSEDAEQWADSILAEMSLTQKVGQLFMPAIYANANKADIALLHKYACRDYVGGIILLKGDTLSAKIMADTLNKMSPVPMFISIDAEWGLGMRLKEAPTYPLNGKIGRSKANDQQMYDYGHEIARQCRVLGINMVLGPVLDVSLPDGSNRFIGNRSFGSDANKVASLGVGYARGLEDGNVLSAAKHFPGHGSPTGDSHNSLQRVTRSLHQLEESDLLPFKRYIEEGLSCIIVGHLSVPALDSKERSATVSPIIIKSLLREKMGFTGLILTDALNMRGASGASSTEAISAGADIILAPTNTSDEIKEVIDSVRAGNIKESELNDRCRRILIAKYPLFHLI